MTTVERNVYRIQRAEQHGMTVEYDYNGTPHYYRIVAIDGNRRMRLSPNELKDLRDCLNAMFDPSPEFLTGLKEHLPVQSEEEPSKYRCNATECAEQQLTFDSIDAALRHAAKMAFQAT